MLTKTKLLIEINKFPEEFSIDELVERLIILEKIEIGIKQSESGQIVSESEIDYEIKKWLMEITGLSIKLCQKIKLIF